jgi:Glutamate/Leucine/Phenylalanine/Valine dehydrogenase
MRAVPRRPGRIPGVGLRKLESTDAFVFIDLDEAEVAVGATRCAPKILVEGAKLLARSQTYLFASFGRDISGASAGVNAKGDAAEAAIGAYVSEVRPDVEANRYLTEAARGIDPTQLAPLREADSRSSLYWEHQSDLRALSAVVVGDALCGGMDGRTVAIEGFDAAGPALARAIADRGGRVVALSTGGGVAVDPGGFDPATLADAWTAHGADLPAQVGSGDPPPVVFATECDVLFTGSKAGVVDHGVAAGLKVAAVVPSGPVPVTAKALAVLRRAGVVVAPDFLSVAGPLFAMWPDDGATIDTVRAEAITSILAAVGEVLDADDGPLLAACERAESHLLTWCGELPFGRPLA